MKDSGEQQIPAKTLKNSKSGLIHFGLPQINVLGRKVHMSPKSRYVGVMKWNRNIPPTWKVDGEFKPFDPK